MEQDLQKIFTALQNGDWRGIVINDLFEDTDYRDKIYHKAINQGFAQPSTELQTWGSEMGLKLSSEGKQYPSYQAFLNRHNRSETNIINSIVGNNNSGNNVGQGLDFGLFKSVANNQSKIQDTSKLQAKSSIDKTEKVKMVSVVITLVAAVIGLITKLMDLW